MRTLIVVPTCNEVATIGEILDRLHDAVPDADVLVVDDDSTDGTRQLVADRVGPTVTLLARDHRGGLGDAYVEAFRTALTGGYEAVVQIDADLSHDPASLPTMLDIARHGIDVVIGSRYVPGGRIVGWPRRRTWLSRWGNRYAAIVLGLAVNDATAGFRVYRADALRRIGVENTQADGYGFQIEMTYRAVRAGMGVVEVPITFRERTAGESKMNAAIVSEAFALVTRWGLADAVTLRRRRRAYNAE